MIDFDILPFGRFKYPQPYAGSYKGMDFRIEHKKPAEGEENLIYLEIWPGPLCYDKTDDAKKIRNQFSYSKEGYDEMLAYMEEIYESGEWIK